MGLTKAPKQKTRKGYTIDQRNYKRLEKVQQAIVEDRYDDALNMLIPLAESTQSRPYDHAIVNQNLNHVYSIKQDWKQAIKHLKISIDLDVFSDTRQKSAIKNLAGLYLTTEQYQKALDLLLDWFKTAVNPTSSDYTNLAYAYARLKNNKGAICPTRLAINTSKEKPKQALFDLLLAAHWELKDFSGAAKVLRENINYYPETKKLWTTLAGVYGQSKKTMDALAIWELTYKNGMFEKESEYKSLYSYYNLHEAPYKAAEMLEREVLRGNVEASEKNWRSIANTWHYAREYDKAIAAYGKAAALSENGELFVRQGELYSDQERWDEAVNAFDKGLEKGGLPKSKEANAYYRKGIAYFNAGNVVAAKKDLSTATSFNSRKKSAKSWLNYIEEWQKQQKLFE